MDDVRDSKLKKERINLILKKLNKDLDLAQISLDNLKSFKRSTVMVIIVGIFILVTISSKIDSFNDSIGVIDMICISIVVSLLVTQCNELIEIFSSIRSVKADIKVNEKLIDEIKKDLSNL